MIDQKDKKKFFSEWLEKLQQESWQLELLISGLALFGIWESKSILEKMGDYIAVYSLSETSFYLRAIYLVFSSSWLIFMFNLLGHIIVRGLWIGAIGLRYVSGDIDFDKLGYSDRFSRYFKKRLGSFDDYIERLERLSSVIFSFTFLLFFLLVSLISTIIVYAATVKVIEKIFAISDAQISSVYVTYGMVYFGFGLIVLIDFFSLGALKKVHDKTFSRVFFYIYLFYSTVSLSFAYRSLLLNFIDHSYTRKFFFLAFPYAFLVLMGFNGIYLEKYPLIPDFDRRASMRASIAEYSVNYNFYDDLRQQILQPYGEDDKFKKEKINFFSLSHYENEHRLNLFLEIVEDDEKTIKARHPDILGFKHSGIKHHMFSTKNVSDKVLERFDFDSNIEIRAMRKIINTKEVPTDSTALALIGSRLNEYLQTDKKDIELIAQQIRKRYQLAEKQYTDERMRQVNKAIMDLYTISIDNEVIGKAFPSFFYTHPNMGERGIICHIPLDSISTGTHYLTVEKITFTEGCIENCKTTMLTVPFLKN